MISSDSPQSGNGVFAVGDLRVDLGQQRVTRNGAEIALPKLSYELLLVLMRAAPNIVSNDQLMELVWPGLVISPETVNQRIKLLRDALGDSSREPRYILGLRGRGYRLVAAVSPASVEEASVPEYPESNSGTAEPESPRVEDERPAAIATGIAAKRTRRLAVALSLLALVVVAAVLFTLRTRHASPALTASAVSAESGAEGQRARTVAVSPFTGLNADSPDSYLSMGIPEMILNRLARMPGLSVIARSSSFSLPANLDGREIGQRLNAGYLIDGSVQRVADRMRIAVNLVDTTGGTVLWSVNFDRKVSDIFAVEDEIAEQVANALSARLGARESKPPPGERSKNVEAYLAFLQGRALLGRFSVAESEAAVPYFERAIALDAQFTPAYASLYDARMQAASQRHEDLAAARSRYAPLIERAVSIDPGSGSAYFARAMWANAPEAERDADFRHGVELDPSNGRGLTAYSEFLEDTGRDEESGRMLKRALRIDPMSPRAHYKDAMRSLDEGNYKILEEKMREVLELDPNFVPALQRYGKYQWELHGQPAAAIQILEHAIAIDPANPWLRHTAMAVYLDLGDAAAAQDVAAGTQQSAAESVLLLALYQGDWRTAGRAAHEEANWTYSVHETWETGEAVRDYALNTGKLSEAVAFLEQKFGLTGDGGARIDLGNFRQAVYLSQLLAAEGHAREANDLRHAAAAWNDANQAKYGTVFARRLRANILLLDGKPGAALEELAGSFESLDYMHWWYTLEFDPLWRPYHDDPRFKVVVAAAKQYIATQREELDTLRHSGAVPSRGVAMPH